MRKGFILLACLCLCFSVFVSMVDAATLNVPKKFKTIQTAIDAAKTGDVIKIAPGTYKENINWLRLTRYILLTDKIR